jgi:DNA repair protein RadC
MGNLKKVANAEKRDEAKAIEEAKRLLEEVNKSRNEKLQEVTAQVNEILNKNECGITSAITQEAWLELGKRFFAGEKVIHLQTSVYLKE